MYTAPQQQTPAMSYNCYQLQVQPNSLNSQQPTPPLYPQLYPTTTATTFTGTQAPPNCQQQQQHFVYSLPPNSTGIQSHNAPPQSFATQQHQQQQAILTPLPQTSPPPVNNTGDTSSSPSAPYGGASGTPTYYLPRTSSPQNTNSGGEPISTSGSSASAHSKTTGFGTGAISDLLSGQLSTSNALEILGTPMYNCMSSPSNALRIAVSKKKKRFQEDGFDLDLSYITPKVIAMGFPSESVEAAFRNPYREVYKFLETRHPASYRVYNLCSERSYEPVKFNYRVEVFPFDDHNCPSFELIHQFCQSCDTWIKKAPKNVSVVHCKAGKGRTGLMVSAYLLHSGTCGTAEEALTYFAAKRTYDSKGVTIPSQIRYVGYYADFLSRNLAYRKATLVLTSATMSPKPLVDENDLCIKVISCGKLVYSSKPLTDDLASVIHYKKERLKKKVHDAHNICSLPGSGAPEHPYQVQLGSGVEVSGDVKLEVLRCSRRKQLFALWFNTMFITVPGSGAGHISFSKTQLDKGDKNKKLPPHFTLDISLKAL
ncbi:protein tyrosine phosphatase [Pelomyxa schiedti]|nr:protein tyrosine phosphatase [Pelomyxa schiedti]